MTDSVKAPAVKAINYTADQVAILVENAPFCLEKAKIVGLELGKSPRSIIAKCLSEGIEYNSKPAPAKREAVETKAEIVAEIETATGLTLGGLEKATAKALVVLRNHFQIESEEETPEISTA
jgi:hypothetical protein